jgi:hypothetical protein
MQIRQFISQNGEDSLLQIPLPDTWKGIEVEVLVVLLPVSKPVLLQSYKNIVDLLAMPETVDFEVLIDLENKRFAICNN